MINPLLLDERYDDNIVDSMMYQPINNELKIKTYNDADIDFIIYEVLECIEKECNVKL